MNRKLIANSLRRLASAIEDDSIIQEIDKFIQTHPQEFCNWMNAQDEDPMSYFFTHQNITWDLASKVKEKNDEDNESAHESYLQELKDDVWHDMWVNEKIELSGPEFGGKYSNDPEFMRYLSYMDNGGYSAAYFNFGNKIGMYGNRSYDTHAYDYVTISKLEDLKGYLDLNQQEGLEAYSWQYIKEQFIELWKDNPPEI